MARLVHNPLRALTTGLVLGSALGGLTVLLATTALHV